MADEQEIKSGSRVGPLAFSGDYVELGDIIGSGAQGQVFACRREKSDARLAAKVVDCQRLQLSADEPEIVVKKMENEVRILRNAEHEHCVGLYDIYRTPRWIVLIMERLEGGELFEQIAKKRTLKEFEAKHVFRQIVSGLAFLHGKKIVHRDLKPENVLIAQMRLAEPPNEDCTLYDIKIADYGLSKYNDEGEPLRSMVGTPQYWAPEMLKAKGREGYDEKVDLWSLGVLLYVMLYGRYPFRGDNVNEQIRTGRFDLSRVKSPPSEDAQDLIRKLLQVNPGARLPLSDCLEHPWLVGPKKKEVATAPQPVAVRAVTPRAPFDLRELLRLQVSLGRSLEIACLACRSQHPELAASIRETIMQAQLLWQQAVKVIGQYAQVSRKVIETVLPDLNLAVQEATPELGYDLLSMVESWIQKMTADSEKMHWLCSELSKHLEKMITQAQAQQLQLQAAAPEGRASPPAPNAICDADAGPQAAPRRRQDLFDELEVFANKLSRGTYSDGAEEAQSRDLVDLLFLSPGFGPGALKALEAPAETSEASRELNDQRKSSTDPTPTAGAPESLSPEPSAAEPTTPQQRTDRNELALCTTGGEVNRYPDYHGAPYLPLLRALYQLRSVSSILQECTAFWGHIESTVQELARTKDHTQALLRHAAKSTGLKERFDQRLAEYGAFWATLLKLCEQYCTEVQPALNKMMVDVRNAEAAADALELKAAAGLSHRMEEAR